MRNTPDPSTHQARERQMAEHVLRLLDDPRLVVDTVRGMRPVKSFLRKVERSDKAVDAKRLLSELGQPDRELQEKLPVGESIDVVLTQKHFFIFSKIVGRLRLICISPTRQLINGDPAPPVDVDGVRKVLREVPPPLAGVPSTIILTSTSGFTIEAHELADRSADRTVILAEPNDASGWTFHGAQQTKTLMDALDPEVEEQKRQRVRAYISESTLDLTGSGIIAEKAAAKTHLPIQFVEAELKTHAKQNPGLVAKRLDGRYVLFREGTIPTPVTATQSNAGDSNMPMIDRIKSLFSRKGETEKKIAFLSERRAALSLQRDRAFDEVASLDLKDAELRKDFAEARTPHTKKRITSQLLQLRKDIERRQQMLNVFNQQVNVVATHLHNLELVQQGTSSQLPDSEEIAQDAAAAEEMLAELQASNELSESVGTASATLGMSDEEKALFEELERETGTATPAVAEKVVDETPTKNSVRVTPADAKPTPTPRERATPEAG